MAEQTPEKQLKFEFMKTKAELMMGNWELERRAFMQYCNYRRQLRELEYHDRTSE